MTGYVHYTHVNELDGYFDYTAFRIVKKIKFNKIFRYSMYCFGLFLMNLYIWIQYDAFQDMNKWTTGSNALYLSTCRIAWGVSLTCVFLPILLGHNQFLVSILSSNFWAPLSKLVFGVYLIHMIIGRIMFFSQSNSYCFNQLNLVLDAILNTVLSFFISFLIHLTVEAPIMNLEKVLLGAK